MTRHRQLLAGLAVYLLLHVCHATPAADLEPCAPGSGRPKPSPSPPAPACTPDLSTTLLSYAFDDADNVGLDSGMHANDAAASSVQVSTVQVQQGTSSAVMTNTNYLQLPSINLDHDEISIAFWIQVDLDTTIKESWNRIFRLHNSNSKTISCGFFRDYRPGSVFFFVGNGNSPTTYSQVDEVSDHPGVGDANTAEVILHNHVWYHITWSMSASKQEWRIDVSGIGSFAFTGMLTHERNIYNDNIINSNTGKNWVGYMDLFQIYTRALDAAAVESIRADGAVLACGSSAPSVTAASNLLAWYRFDTTPADQATLVNHGTGGATFDATIHMQTNGIQQIAGSHASHAYFWPNDENNGNFVTIPAGILQAIDDDGYTFSFWMIDNQVTDNDMLIMSGIGAVDSFSHSNGGYFIKIYAPWTNSIIVLDNYNGPVDKHRVMVSCVWCIENSKLTFMSFTRENIDANSMQLRIYKDAVLLHEEVKPLTMFTNADPAQSVFFMGFDHDATWRFRDKSLEDFRIYNRALTAEEIAAIYAGDLGSAPAANAPSVTAASNLLAWYRFDTTPADQATLVNHGTGGASFDATIYFAGNGIEQIAGNHATHAYFWTENSPHGNYIDIPGTLTTKLDEGSGHTITFWLTDYDVTDRDMLLMTGIDGQNLDSTMSIKIFAPWSNGVVYYLMKDASRSSRYASGTNILANGEQAMLTLVRENVDASTMKLRLYKNAVLIDEQQTPFAQFTLADDPGAVMYLGFNLDDSWVFKNKVLDDFRIYDKPLTVEEIAAIYAGDLASAEASIAEANSTPVSTACEACTPGFFSPNGTTCEPCAPGSISTHYNATSCEPCNATSTSFRGTSSCFDLAAHLAATGCVCGV